MGLSSSAIFGFVSYNQESNRKIEFTQVAPIHEKKIRMLSNRISIALTIHSLDRNT